MKNTEKLIFKNLIAKSELNERVRNSRDRSRLETRRRLMEAGVELFARDGYEKTSMAAVAEKAQVSSGTVFFHFKSKDGLLQEIALHYLYGLHESLRETDRIATDDIEQHARMHTETIVKFFDASRSIFSVIISRMNSGSEVGKMLTQLLVNEQADRFREGIAQGLFRDDVDVEIAAQATIGLLFNVMSWWVNQPAESDRETLIDTLTKIRFSGVYNRSIFQGDQLDEHVYQK